jgi:CO/xanthine dehydrogenase Mo-binding subunit
MGLAVQAAARQVRERLRELAGERFGCAAHDVAVRDGRLCGAGREATFRELMAGGSRCAEIAGTGAYPPADADEGIGGRVVFWEIGAGGAEVDVDPETGTVTVHRYVSVTDAGRAINPLLAEGQDEGAAMQALGHALFEELAFEDGQLLNGSLVEYRVPAFPDLPDEFGTVLVENGDGPGPFGCKGIGESGVLSVAPAIANAVYDACGVRIRQLPLTPERVWRAWREEREADDERPADLGAVPASVSASPRRE